MGYAIMNGSVEHFSIGHAAVDGKPLNISTGGDMKHVTDHLETNLSTSGESLCKTMLYDARVDEEEAMERHSQPGVPESQSINPLEKKSRSDTGRVDVNYNRSKSNLSGSVGNVVVNQETAFVINTDYCNNDDDSFKKLPDGQHRKHSKLRALKSLPFHLKLHHRHDSDTTRGPGDVHGSPYSRFDEGHRQRSKSLSVKPLQFFKHCQQHPRIEQKTLSNWHSKRKRAFLHGHERSKSFDNFHQRKSNRLRSLRSLKLDGNLDSTLNTDNDNALYDSSMLSRLVDKPVHRKSRRTSSKKGKFNVTPPSTPTSVSSFSSQQQNGQHAGRGFYARNVSQTSVGEDEGIDGHFKFLETIGPNYPSVFTISNPTTTSSSTDDTQRSRQKSGSPKSAYDNVAFDNRGSNFSENKYNWTETDGPSSRVSDDYSKTKSSTRRICIAVCLAILVLAILAGVAVILAYLVFNVGDKKEVPDTTTIRPAILTTDGSLDLKLTWTPELNDPASSLYSETEYNFTTEMDRIMKESNFSDSYIRTEVIAFSPGSIKVDFRMDHNENYKQKANSANQYAADIEKHLKRVAREAVLPIDEGTVHIKAVGSTSSVLPSTTVAATSMVSSITTGNQTLTMTSQISPTKTTTQSSSDFKSSRNVTDTFVISSQTDTLTPSPVISSTTQPSSINATETYSSTNPVTLPSEQISKVSSHSGTLSSPTLTPSADLTGTLPSVTLSILSTTELLTKTETISGSLVTDHLTSPSSSSYFICNYTFVTASEHTSRLFITPTPTAKQSTSQLSTTEKLSSTPTSVLPTLSPTDKLTTSSLEKSTLTTVAPSTTTLPTTPSVAPPNTTTTKDSSTSSSTTTTTESTTSTTESTSTTTSTSTISSTASTTSTPSSTSSSSTTTTTTPSTTTAIVDKPPVAKAGVDKDIFDSSVTLDGSQSTDDNGIVQWEWLQVSPDTPKATLVDANTDTVKISGLVEGNTYVFSLTVKDSLGQSSSDTVQVIFHQDLCQPVTFEPCLSRGFEYTVFPNLFNHENASLAEEAFNVVSKDVKNQICQESALTYLCSLYFAKCDRITGLPEYPCGSLCNDAVTTCGNYFMNPFGCEYFQETDCTPLPVTTPAPTTTATPHACEETRATECVAHGFNETKFPNVFGEPNQDSALGSFYGFFKIEAEKGCHADMMYFVCSVQFPKCTESKVYKPCRRVCQDIIAACPDMSNYFVCNEFAAIDCLAPPKPQAECTQSQFSCGKVTKCISRDLVCNGIDDCSDWTDEMDCVCDPQVMFKCDMGMCIKSYQQCDGTPQCPDNSDERNCKCSHGQVACPDGKCIMAEWICDDRSECDDGWDESNCEICGRDFFTCKDRNKTCVPIQKKCDGSPDCPDGFDEVDCIKDDSGELRLSTMKTDLPICADSWRDTYGEMACERLGRGSYINKTNVRSIMPAFLRLGPSSVGNMHRSVLGPVQTVYTCEDNMAMRINCKPRGCGKRQIPITIPFIVNGEPAPVAAWPWHVALYYGGQYFCGGSLIHKEFVLTAAHCVDKYVRNYDLMTVKLGANNRESKENTQHVVSVEAVHSHTEHVYFVKNDIALIQLASAVQFTKYIQPICLPEVDEHLPLYSTCFTIGWGKTKWDGEYSEVLQQLKMTLWDTNKCNSSLAWNGEVFDTFLCAGYYSGIRSICTGDSGGPLLCQDNYQNWKVVGVSSYVANYCNMTERPNIFSKVEHFLPWINDIIECKFQCDNGKCLYNRDYICDRIDHCGDNSDETRICNRTVTCDFEDKFLCGYEFNGWQLGQDNKLSTKIDTGGILHTQSNAPQYDHTVGRPPGHFFYGKNSSVRDAYLWSPRFNASGQMCVRFAYYLRGDVSVGLKVNLNEYFRGSDQFTTITRWPVHSLPKDSPDEWKTGYFDISLGEHQLNFTTGDLLTAAIDDVEVLPGMCSNVLCKTDEYRCKGLYGDKCIPRASRCNLVIDCQDGNGDEITCANSMGSYLCTFEDGNMCGLKQEVGDGTDWWLVDASFVQSDTNNKKIKDHTFGNDSGHVFYINAYGVQSGTNIYMSQRFYLHSAQYCLSFYYQMRADVTLNVHVDCDEGCTSQTHMAQATFDDNWALFQVTLPSVDAITVTYDVLGDIINMFTSFIVMDDISVKAGVCPEYVCPAAYTKCRTADRCIPVTSICDRNVDCLDEYDEENCFCNSTEYRCANGRCLPLENKCDRVPQCLDKSDEGDVCRPLEIVSCSFEHSYICGYQFINTTNYKWRRYSGPTLTPQTGPSHDHTYGTRFGHYLYAEANEGSKGDNASVVSPQFVTGKGNSLEFYYHVFSSSPYDHMPGVLRFSIKNQQNNDSVYVWDSDPLDLRDEWRWFCYDLPVMMTVRAWFTSIRNETTTYGVDIAIDDVKINTQACSDITTPGPTVQPPTTDKTKASNCIEGQWECRSGVCVPNSYVCDKHSDCPDGSDEEGCP